MDSNSSSLSHLFDPSTIEFDASNVILLSELNTRERERYYSMLITYQIKFKQDNNGNYIANMRLLSPNIKKSQSKSSKELPQEFSWDREDRFKRLQNDETIIVQIVGVDEFNYTIYQRFSGLIANPNDVVKPKRRTLSWLMKTIEDIYDSRFIYEKLDIEKEDSNDIITNVSDQYYGISLSIFPFFVIRRLTTVVGLPKITDATCWDLLYNTDLYRHDYLEVEVFARFLQEFYNQDDLLFFLFVRNIISNLLHINFKNRWIKSDGPSRQSKVIWISYRECILIAKTIFGSTNEGLYKDFLSIILPHMVGQRSDSVDSRRIDVTQFLHLSVVGYHQTQNRNEGGDTIQNSLSKLPENDQVDNNNYDDKDLNSHNEDNNNTIESDLYIEEGKFEKAYNQSFGKTSNIRNNQYNADRDLRHVVDGLLDQEFGDYDASFDAILAAVVKEKTQTISDYTARSVSSTGSLTPKLSSNSNMLNNQMWLDEKGEWQEDKLEHSLDNSNELDEYSQLQLEREKIVMAKVCESMVNLSDEIVENVMSELALSLRDHVNEALENVEVSNIQDFDRILNDILTETELLQDLEILRDELINEFSSKFGKNSIG